MSDTAVINPAETDATNTNTKRLQGEDGTETENQVSDSNPDEAAPKVEEAPVIFRWKEFDMKKFHCDPKSSKSSVRVAYCTYDGVKTPYFQFLAAYTSGFSQYDPNSKDKKKNGKDSAPPANAAAGDNNTDDAKKEGDNTKDWKLPINIKPEDEAKVEVFQDALPDYIFENKELLYSLYGDQTKLKEKERHNPTTLSMVMNKFHKPGEQRKDEKGNLVFDNGKPVNYQTKLWLTTKLKNKKLCFELWTANDKAKNLVPKLVYAHYENDDQNVSYLATIETLKKQNIQVVEEDPFKAVKNCNVIVTAQLLGLYRTAAAYGPSFRVHQVRFAPGAGEKKATKVGQCIILDD